LNKIDEEKVEARKKQIATYNEVLSLTKIDDEDTEKLVLDRVFANLAILFKLEKGKGFEVIKSSLKRIDRNKKKNRQVKVEETTEINKEERNKEGTVITNIFVRAKLNNFQIWVPLKADNLRSQIFNFSFMSEL
jgi:hypothetical protein